METKFDPEALDDSALDAIEIAEDLREQIVRGKRADTAIRAS